MRSKLALQIVEILIEKQKLFINECYSPRELNLIDKFTNEIIQEIRKIHDENFKKRFKRHSRKGKCEYCEIKTGSNHKKDCPVFFKEDNNSYTS